MALFNQFGMNIDGVQWNYMTQWDHVTRLLGSNDPGKLAHG